MCVGAASNRTTFKKMKKVFFFLVSNANFVVVPPIGLRFCDPLIFCNDCATKQRCAKCDGTDLCDTDIYTGSREYVVDSIWKEINNIYGGRYESHIVRISECQTHTHDEERAAPFSLETAEAKENCRYQFKFMGKLHRLLCVCRCGALHTAAPVLSRNLL